MNCQRKVCLVLLVGIPASGKTFFGTFLQSYLESNSNSVLGSVQFYRICYDDYLEVRWPQLLSNGDCWKSRRLEVFKHVEQVVLNIRDCHVLKDAEVSKAGTYDTRPVLILIDDNMYLRSMRYEYFKLARTHCLGFCQTYFDMVRLDCAIQYNKTRSITKQVPEHIIQDMFVKIEPPSPSNYWETKTVTLKPYIDYEAGEELNELLLCIKHALDNPIQNVSSFYTEQSLESRRINDCNTIHRVDNILKRLIGSLIKSELKENKVSDAKLISQHYCNKRQQILKKIKHGSIQLEVDLSQPDISKNLNLVEPFLLSLLKN